MKKNRNCNNFNILMALSVLRISDPASVMLSSEESQSTILDNSNKQLSSVNHKQIISNLLFHSEGEFHQYFSLSIYQYLQGYHVTWDYNRHCSIIGMYYLSMNNSICLFQFKTANQPGFEPGSPGPKVAMLIIELHSI